MNKRFAIFILFGLLIGAMYGVFFGAALSNPPLGVALGGLGGLYIGWFIFAAVVERQKSSGDFQMASLMEKPINQQHRIKPGPMIKAGLGLIFGFTLGLIIGYATGYPALGPIFGAGIGLILGAALDLRYKKKT